MYIDYKKQPTNMSCGQTCVSMIMWKPVEEICGVIKKKGGTYTKDLVNAFEFFDVPTSKKLIRKSINKKLPDLCIIKLKHSDFKGTHWSIYHNEVFYDPAIGIVEKYDEKIKILSYLEIYQEPNIDYNYHLNYKKLEK